jgi:hypothetical protein
MKAPRLPRSEVTAAPEMPAVAASNEGLFGAAAPAAPVSKGWDPYEVWRSRILVAQPAGYNKPRGNTRRI